MTPVRRLVALFAATGLLAAGCAPSNGPDAYGNVEATSVVVSAETGGRLVSFTIDEGTRLTNGQTAGAVDAVQLALARDQLKAQRAAAAAGAAETGQRIRSLQAQQDAARAQRSALQAQRDVADRAYARAKRLSDQQAGTAQQLDQAEREARVVADQLTAQDHQIDALAGQIQAARHAADGAHQQVAALDAQIAQAEDRIRRSTVTSPIDGTVLETYVEAGEYVQPGQPLFTVADLRSVDVRAYVTEAQLAALRLGETARVTVDVGEGMRRSLDGTVSWIASQAEFTPTPIQTREERADLVYAIKIQVPNPEGLLKIGMPVDVEFVPAS
jgi:membrane fusion protein YbhG